ncbi:MAG TPA: nucleotidyltransferase family protein [Conexivisphaerales archaeon]|nr:nucleotidyltransferase family protein [Conexivisphaerales archaeon]
MGSLKAAVLCGGLGSRLRPLTYYFQKTMLPVGERQKPILEYILRTLKYNGIDKAVLLASYKAEQIQNYFKSGASLSMELSYVADDPSLKGNGGALLNAYRKGVLNEDDQILVYYGDILTTMDLKGMMKRHTSSGSEATLAVARGYRLPVGVANVRGDRLIRMEEKPTVDIRVGIGILALKGDSLIALDSMSEGSSELDIMGQLIPKMIAEGRKVRVFQTKAYWLDVGSIETYEKLDHVKLDESFSELFLYERERKRET